MSQKHIINNTGQQQNEQELLESFLNFDVDHDFNDDWLPQPTYPSQSDSTKQEPFDDFLSSPIDLHHGQSKPFEFSSTESWQQTSTGRGARSRKVLPRKRSTYLTSRAERNSNPILIPAVPPSQHPPDQLDPMQRWRHSPPVNEPAAISAIHRALEDNPASHLAHHEIPSSPLPQLRSTSAPNLPTPFRTYRQASSRASSESGLSESSQRSTVSTKSHKRVRRRNRQNIKTKTSKEEDKRRFKCTFCCDDFRTKYDWARHEKSLHLDVEEWICCPQGSMVFSTTTTNGILCAYCDALDPDLAHLESHNYTTCDDPSNPTTFHRKDHLVQHLRLAHHLDTLPSTIDDWKTKSPPLTSRCGFCDAHLSTWDERTAHLSEHFRQGYTMVQWLGDHGLDAATAAKVRNNIPPYIIGYESNSFVPFKAGDAQTLDHFNQISQFVGAMDLAGDQFDHGGGVDDVENLFADELFVDTTVPDLPQASTPNIAVAPHTLQSLRPSIPAQAAAQPQTTGALPSPLTAQPESEGYLTILTRHLSRFAREQILRGVVPTDAMFQNEARKAIYGSEDAWDNTVADSSVWMAEFRRGRGL